MELSGELILETANKLELSRQSISATVYEMEFPERLNSDTV